MHLRGAERRAGEEERDWVHKGLGEPNGGVV